MHCKSVFIIVLMIVTTSLAAQTQPADVAGHQWWQDTVFYEVYPRSFADSNNDGIGDLNGIASKLDYLKDLGVNAIWITPCFPSPQVDFGYDVSDYENIDPMYGTLADFDRLEEQAKQHGIRIILDFVMNHSSDQHQWFVDSRSSRASAHRDWYIWRDSKGLGKPPSNWISIFGGSAWKFDPKTGQYYYHIFYPQQPDLNWRNPAVEKAMFDVTRWWYKRGVAGFRLDAVNTLFEDPSLRDNPVLPGKDEYGDPNTDPRYNENLPQNHALLRRLRAVADESHAVLIGETWTSTAAGLKKYYGENNDELQMPMDFMFTTVNKLSPPDFRRQIAAVNASGGWPVYVLSNHDIVRSYVRYGDGQHNDAIARMMAAFYLTLRGTPIMYYGEEIGMTNNDPKRKEDVKDPIGKRGWPKEKGRDGERTPMQWNEAANAGFSTAKPWLPVPPTYKSHNVEAELKDPASILQVYRRVLSLRHQNAALRDGDYLPLNENDPHVLSYLRRYQNQAVLVVVNMSGQPQEESFDLHALGLGSKCHTLLRTAGSGPSDIPLSHVSLAPFAAYIGEIIK